MDSKSTPSPAGSNSAEPVRSFLLFVGFAATVFAFLMTPWLILADQPRADRSLQTSLHSR